MKKVTLLIVMICSLSVYSRSAMNYLIQQGGGNGSTWTKTLGANDSIVDLTIANKDFTGWLTSRTSWLAGDQVWVAAGTYNIASVWTIPSIVVGSVYGGFAGTENSVGERSKGVNAWIYLNETVINGSASTAGILNAGGDRTMVIDGLTFTGCSSTAGQAVYQRPNMTIQNCKFTSNACVALRYYITAASKTASATNCYFYSNTNAVTGGAEGGCIMANNGSSGGTYSVTGCVFDSNSSLATGSGASAGIKAQGVGSVNISNCIFKNNNATAGNSSAVSLTSATCSLKNSLIYGTSLATNKSAVYVTAGSVVNCTVVNNLGGGIYLSNASSSTINIINTVFWGEDAKSGQVSAVASCLGTITNCAYTSLSTNFTGTTTNSVDLAVTSTGLFADPANNLWSLITASPLIDSGTATGAPANDLIGTVRPQGTTIDVGAYEYTNATSLSELSNLNYKIINGNLIIKGLERNEIVNVYNVTGSKILSLKSDGNEIIAPISNGVYIISIKSRNIKVLVNK